MLEILTANLGIIVPVVAIVFVVIAIALSGYVKAPPDTAYIISGFKKEPRILIGRAGIKIPFLERKDNLVMKQISVDIKTGGFVPTLDFIGVDIDAVAKIRVKADEEGMALAMKNFLNMSEDEICDALTDSLQGNMREIIGTVKLKELCTDRKKFGDETQEKAQKDMNALGIEIISCNIQRIEDEKGLILALGQDNMSQIQKDASIAKAQADRDVAIAEAESAKAANEARVSSDMAIAARQNELAIRQAELKKESDVKKAEADAAYKIQEQEQRKSIEVATVAADIAKTEQAAQLKEREVEVTKKTLDAQVRAKADADRYAAEQKAEADLFKRQKEAEAKLFEEQQAAEAAKARASAKLFEEQQAAAATLAKAEAEAKGTAAVGKAEAEAIQAKALAEAEGIDKKAEAMKKYGEAAIVEMLVNVLPDIAKNVAEPLTKVDKITMYGDGNTAKLIQDIINGTTQVTEGMTAGLGIDLKSLLAGFLGGKAAAPKAQPDDNTDAVG